jgi:hypothetical protein
LASLHTWLYASFGSIGIRRGRPWDSFSRRTAFPACNNNHVNFGHLFAKASAIIAADFFGNPDKERCMTRSKSVRTDRVWLRDDFADKLEKFEEEQKFGDFLHSTPNGSAIGQYLRHERKVRGESIEAEYRFFYDANSQKADYLAVLDRMDKYPTVIRHTVENVTPDEAKTIDDRTACTLRWSPAQFGWAVAEVEIERQAQLDTAE